MRGPLAALAVVVCALLALAAWALARPRVDGSSVDASLSLIETLGGSDTTGYARATAPRDFVFPDDHGPHPDFRTEWWYWTGNLQTADGDRFGFQLTFFRSALAPGAPDSASPWATNQAWLAHFALTDVGAERFRAFERFGRGGVGIAGAVATPFRVWLEDWEVRGGEGGGWPLSVEVADRGVRIELRLEPRKPVVLQGEEGLSRKGPEEGNASYYYSFTRLAAEGTVVVDGEARAVTGTAWFDREWSTSVLSEGQVGWDWFALQLAEGRELMLYHLRRADGRVDPLSAGVLVAEDGSVTRLGADDFQLTATGSWASPLDGAVYPSGWRVRVADAELDLTVRPVLDHQELDLSFRYWEGAVDVRGTGAGEPVVGWGYAELTGYPGGDGARRAVGTGEGGGR